MPVAALIELLSTFPSHVMVSVRVNGSSLHHELVDVLRDNNPWTGDPVVALHVQDMNQE